MNAMSDEDRVASLEQHLDSEGIAWMRKRELPYGYRGMTIAYDIISCYKGRPEDEPIILRGSRTNLLGRQSHAAVLREFVRRAGRMFRIICLHRDEWALGVNSNSRSAAARRAKRFSSFVEKFNAKMPQRYPRTKFDVLEVMEYRHSWVLGESVVLDELQLALIEKLDVQLNTFRNRSNRKEKEKQA